MKITESRIRRIIREEISIFLEAESDSDTSSHRTVTVPLGNPIYLNYKPPPHHSNRYDHLAFLEQSDNGLGDRVWMLDWKDIDSVYLGEGRLRSDDFNSSSSVLGVTGLDTRPLEGEFWKMIDYLSADHAARGGMRVYGVRLLVDLEDGCNGYLIPSIKAAGISKEKYDEIQKKYPERPDLPYWDAVYVFKKGGIKTAGLMDVDAIDDEFGWDDVTSPMGTIGKILESPAVNDIFLDEKQSLLYVVLNKSVLGGNVRSSCIVARRWHELRNPKIEDIPSTTQGEEDSPSIEADDTSDEEIEWPGYDSPFRSQYCERFPEDERCHPDSRENVEGDLDIGSDSDDVDVEFDDYESPFTGDFCDQFPNHHRCKNN